MNTREIAKKERIKKINIILDSLRKEGKPVNFDRLVAMLIVENGISKKTAIEEIKAVMTYNE